jgi:hypothetical protein
MEGVHRQRGFELFLRYIEDGYGRAVAASMNALSAAGCAPAEFWSTVLAAPVATDAVLTLDCAPGTYIQLISL